MRKRVRLIFAAVVLLVAATTHAVQSPSAKRPGVPQTSAIDAVLSQAVMRGDIPGVVAMAADRRGIIYKGAFGVSETATARPLKLDSMFRIASMTKPVTSVAAMQLIEAGRVRLDDPAEKYVPELANLKVFESFDSRTGAYTVRPAKKAVTVRQLLTHTSGLGYNFTSPVVRDFKPHNGEQYTAGPLLFDPGEQWLYGTSTDWVGRLVESVSGRSLEQYFRERIFGPLEMADTFYNPPTDKQQRLVVVHRRQSDGSFAADANQPAISVTTFVGGTGLASTASDYIRFLQMLLNDGTWGGARILSSESIGLMAKNQIGNIRVRALKTAMPERSSDFTFVNDGRDMWGLGFLISAVQKDGKRSAGSLSWGGLNNTYFWVDRSRGIAGVVMMQFLPFADGKALAVCDAFERAVYDFTNSRSD
jgi:CubicO group peptidase (beta-lactamase class C family)